MSETTHKQGSDYTPRRLGVPHWPPRRACADSVPSEPTVTPPPSTLLQGHADRDHVTYIAVVDATRSVQISLRGR